MARYLAAMLAMAGPGGMMPEQVWDADPIPAQYLAAGHPSGAAMPLVWAHAEFLKLVAAARDRQPIERLAVVAGRYGGTRPAPRRRHWRSAAPLERCAAGTPLVVENERPFVLRYSLDGWAEVRDRDADPLPLGLFGVTIEGQPAGTRLDFTRRYAEGWEGRDHGVTWS